MIICVDFDGTIVDHVFPAIGKPAPHSLMYLKRFVEEGAKIVLFTMRSDGQDSGDVLTQAVDFLKAEGVELYGVNRNPDQDSWTSSPKAYGQLYIDDAAFGTPMIHPEGFSRPCVDWVRVGPPVLAMIEQERRTMEGNNADI